MRPKPVFEIESYNVVYMGDCCVLVPKSPVKVAVRWHQDGVSLSADRSETDGIYVKNDSYKAAITEKGLIVEWLENPSTYTLSLYSGETKFADIHVWFISVEQEWNDYKRTICDKGACFRYEQYDIEEGMLSSLTGGGDAGYVFRTMLEKLEDAETLYSDGLISKDDYAYVRTRWGKLVYLAAVNAVATLYVSDNIIMPAMDYIKSYLKSTL